jgi:hypothetical protein
MPPDVALLDRGGSPKSGSTSDHLVSQPAKPNGGFQYQGECRAWPMMVRLVWWAVRNNQT